MEFRCSCEFIYIFLRLCVVACGCEYNGISALGRRDRQRAGFVLEQERGLDLWIW